MTVVLCIFAIGCSARGGHATPPPVRGGHAVTVTVRDPIGSLANWVCIHSGRWPDGRAVARHGEGPWNANTGNGYHGGLQMDWSFMRAYGRDMLAKYRGAAELWTPRDQMVVAWRAVTAGRGYRPWPLTARACGLI